MYINKTHNTIAFNGKTTAYLMTDTHQETRKTCAFLSEIIRNKENNNTLLLNAGDIFKGIYSKDLERDSYIKLKEAKPNLNIVMTLGNNDFGFNKESLDYLVDTAQKFNSKGIEIVCANIFNTNGERPKWLKPYTIVESDGDKNFITGFCINNINTARFGIVAKNQSEVIDEIQKAIIKEKPDNIIFLNHDYMPVSQDLVKTFKEKGINVNLVVGGHDHEFVEPDKKLNIYYPESFANSMYKLDLVNVKNKSFINNIELLKSKDLKVTAPFEDALNKYEKETGLFNKIAPSILNLTKCYSKPCALGSFLADNIKNVSNSDIAIFSTGFLMGPMEYTPNSCITNYTFKKTMNADNPLKTVDLNAEQLKEIFQHALKSNGYGNSNPRFLQCSNNVKIEGKNNQEQGIWEVKQIYINNEPILDKKSNPKASKKFKCTVDSYIADGGQGFPILHSLEKKNVIKKNDVVRIDEVLKNALEEAPNKYKKGFKYPCFEICEI